MSRNLICDLIFNMEHEWGLRDIVEVAKSNYNISITLDQVQEAIDFLREKGVIS